MDVIIQVDKQFEKDEKALSQRDQETIKKKINHVIELIRNNHKPIRQLSRIPIKIVRDFDSSLYTMRINNTIKIILTSEEDPLFDSHVLTLLRIVRVADLDKVYHGLAESFNQAFLNRGGNNG
jgi:mRNA-degrading endonuclease YafQ of YafQ-DinJ toxin-antitoxin module